MSDVNSRMRDVSSRAKKVQKELESLVEDYSSLSATLKKKLRDEVSYNGSYEGLETFNALNNVVSKNYGSIRNASYLVKKLKDLSGFNVSEIEEEVINGNISKLMK
jgi:hypothetical protein